MTKVEFLQTLDKKLFGLAENEIEERLIFYSEMIDDRIEEGLSEEEAVAAVGDVDEIAASIMADFSQPKTETETEAEVKPEHEQKTKRHISSTEIALLIIGFPLWFPLIIAGFVVGLALYISAWAVMISLWAAFVSIAASSVAALFGGMINVFGAHPLTGIALFGAALVLAGLSVFAYYGCKVLSKLIIMLTKWIFRVIKGLFTKKEVA